MIYDCVVVGAGASGLMAAITAARREKHVLVLEKLAKPAKKILATGNGRCNFTNMNYDEESFRGSYPQFAYKALERFSAQDAISFFEGIGVLVTKEHGGYMYPYSGQAASIRDALLYEAKASGAELVTEVNIDKCRWNANKEAFELRVQDKQYIAKKLVLACGGCAAPVHGSDGSGYILAQHFGHRIIKPLCALTQLVLDSHFPKAVKGVRCSGAVTLYDNACNKAAYESGELLFNDYGISGIPVLQLSRYAAKLLDEGKGSVLSVDFFPKLSVDELEDIIQTVCERRSALSCTDAFDGLLHYKLAAELLKHFGIKAETKASELKLKHIKRFAASLKDMRFEVSAVKGFENAQVTAGGVDTSQIENDTMESKLQKGLYITGELLDIDGNCGGYNLQWAWTSGYIAGMSI